MTAEERLGNVKAELENLMNLNYQHYLQTKENHDNFQERVEAYYSFIQYHGLWSKCLDPKNVIDKQELEKWEIMVENMLNN